MSSIDKYVEGEARKFNPRVKVTNIGGRIEGRINGDLVFSIADRYGYLSDSERNIIRTSMNEYEAEERHRQEMERIRLENERRAAKTSLLNKISEVKSNLSQSRNATKEIFVSAENGLELKKELDRIDGFNLSAFYDKLNNIEKTIQNSKVKVESEYKKVNDAIFSIEQDLDEELSTQQYNSKLLQLQNLSTSLSAVTLPFDEIEKLRADISQIKEAVSELSSIKQELSKFSGNDEVGRIASNAIKVISEFRIATVDDINSLIIKINESLSKIKEIQYNEIANKRIDKLESLNGILKSCVKVREYINNCNYTRKGHREEIVKTANNVLRVYSELQRADYTTCDRVVINDALNIVQKVLMGEVSDENTLKALDSLLDEGKKYQTVDRLQKENYDDYCAKRQELLDFGISLDNIEDFNPFAYSEQRKRLNKMLMEQDNIDAASRTRTSFYMACRVMQDMGFQLVSSNIGSEDDTVEDALACEAIYAKPGCEGVVYRILTSDCNISRQILPIKRSNGSVTSAERVREVAMIDEANNEHIEFFRRYSEIGGGEINPTKSIDSDSSDCLEQISNIGAYEFPSDSEKTFDEIVNQGSAEEKGKYQTKLGKIDFVSVKAKTFDNTQSRKNEAQHTKQKIMAKRK